jgi:hypothetical protein
MYMLKSRTPQDLPPLTPPVFHILPALAHHCRCWLCCKTLLQKFGNVSGLSVQAQRNHLAVLSQAVDLPPD